MSKVLAVVFFALASVTAIAADGSRTEIRQLDVKPTVIFPADAPVAAAAPAPETSTAAKAKAGKKQFAKKQAGKKHGHAKPAKRQARPRK